MCNGTYIFEFLVEFVYKYATPEQNSLFTKFLLEIYHKYGGLQA